MSGSHYAPEPPALARPDEQTIYDLRTADARENDRLAQLELRMDNLVDVCERQAQRIARLEAENRAREAENKALREAVTLHADLLQHYRLTAGI